METTPDIVAMINDAIGTKNWPLLVVAVLMILVPVVLKLLGKDVPFVSSVLIKVAEFFKSRPPVQEPPKPEEEPQGVDSVVKVVDEKK